MTRRSSAAARRQRDVLAAGIGDATGAGEPVGDDACAGRADSFVRLFTRARLKRAMRRPMQCSVPPHAGHTYPPGQRHTATAARQSSSLPLRVTKRASESPFWNWMRLRAIGISLIGYTDPTESSDKIMA